MTFELALRKGDLRAAENAAILTKLQLYIVSRFREMGA